MNITRTGPGIKRIRLGCLLPNHFVRILVFPDSEKDRLTETVIPRPLREFYLADHRRFDPMTTLHFGSGQPLVPTAPTSCREVEKGTLFNPDFVQLRKETAKKLFAEAGSDSAGKFKFLAFVEANKQRAKILSRAFRLGVSADNKFLLLMELDFDPCSGALSGLIPGTAAFTNQTFKPEFVSPVQKLWNVFREGDRIPNYTGRFFQQFFQLCFSFFDW